MSPASAGAVDMMAGHVLMQPKSLSAHGDSEKHHEKSSLCLTLHEVASNP